MVEKLRLTYTFTEDRIEELKAVVPEAFADGKINWDVLREALGEHLEDEENERFGLFWPGKREARRLASIPVKGTLVPVHGEGVNEDNTQNIFIEGENLEVLRLLTKSYAGQIKFIYIDPPYNTGNDFIYSDDYSEPLQTYLKRTGQLGEKEELLTSNSRADGRFHSNWLSLLYPRLLLARSLLREDGLIFVSIDDNEVHHLRAILNEIFGERNFVEQIVWKNKYGSGALTKGLANVHEYILCYSRQEISSIGIPLDEEDIKKYSQKDSKFVQRGGYVTQPLATTSKDERPNLRYPIYHEEHEIWPEKQWVWSEERFLEAYENDEIVIRQSEGKFSVRFKQYLKDEEGNIRRKKPVSIFLGPFNQEGTKEIREIFGAKVFDFPKPSSLIKRLFSFVINDELDTDGIYMDFFSGSCPAAHALMEMNFEDSGSRRFIMVQLPEEVPANSEAAREGYLTIADIGKERIRRVGSMLQDQAKAVRENSDSEFKLDQGFRVYRLTSSNYKVWSDYRGDDLREYQTKLAENALSPLVQGWKREDLLAEVMLSKGFPLDSEISRLSNVTANVVFRISTEFHSFNLNICLDDQLAAEVGAQLLELPEDDIFICMDGALSDELKMQLEDAMNLFAI